MGKKKEIPVRILVTGSRGKSTLVRMLASALVFCGLSVRGRITGVLPRELSAGDASISPIGREGAPLKETLLFRSGPASVEEMRWWLSTLPHGTDAVVMENSAVAPELQPLAFRWLRPNCTVLTNVRPDHEDAWGAGEENAILSLCSGISGAPSLSSFGHPVVLPRSVAEKPLARDLLLERGCDLHSCDDRVHFKDTHLALVESVCRLFGLDPERGRVAASSLPPDVADFGLFRENEGVLASAFSANDLETTEFLFRSTGWSKEDTTVLFNSRRDRTGRLKVFLPWLRSSSWRKVCITGSRPVFLHPASSLRYTPLDDVQALLRFVDEEGHVFGCGNVAGVPLEYLVSKYRRITEREDARERL